MADNVAVTPGSGATIAADELAGSVYIQRVKPAWGVDGTATDVSASDPMPVVQTGTIAAVTTVSAVTAITNALPAGDNNIGNVDIVTLPALVAGSAAIGKLAANSGVDIGDVDVTSVIAGTGATNIGKAVQGTAGATDTGVAMLAVRDDALTTLTADDGEYAQLRVDETGALQVKVVGSDVGSTTATEDGNVPDDATTVVTTIAFPYSHTGDAWTREGATVHRSIDLDETEEAVKAGPGVLYAFMFSNTASTARYLHFYDALIANITVGSTTSYFTMYMPAESSSVPMSLGPTGVKFATAISVAATTGVADAGAPGTNEVLFTAFYK